MKPKYNLEQYLKNIEQQEETEKQKGKENNHLYLIMYFLKFGLHKGRV